MTALALVLAPVACSLVLLLSGAAKVRDPTATRAAFTALDVPNFLRGPAAVRSLPYVELGLGVALLATWGWVLAVVAGFVTALFITYAVLVARVLRKGDRVHCNCFGTIGDDRVTGSTLARNAVLAVLAALATAFGAAGSGVVPAVRDLDGADWWWPVMTALVVAASVLVVAPGRHDEPERVPDEELLDYLRQPIPFGILEDEDGRRTALRQLAAERAQLLVFMSLGCNACYEVASQLADWAARLGPVEISEVFTDPLEGLPPAYQIEGVRQWHDVDRAVTDMFASGRPAAVLLGADGLMAGGPVFGPIGVARFVEDILAEIEGADAPGPDHHHDNSGHDHTDHDHTDHDHEAEASA